MKKSLLIGIACVALIYSHATAGNYVVTIDGKKHEVDVGKQTTIELSDGKKIQVTLEKKAIVSFDSKKFSFDYPSAFTPSQTDLGGGIHQTMMATPLGTLILVQEYDNMDPSSLVNAMLNELIKKEKQYGYKITKNPAKIKLASGKTLTGKQSIATYRGKQTTRQVLCYSVEDAGIMVITQVAQDASPKDIEMVDVFWKTFKILLK